MKCHQILTGAVNSGDNTYSVGSVEGIHFTAYSSGCNIVILSPNFERVQIIPGVLNGNVQVNCIDASTDVGKIAACYGGPFKSNQLTVPSAYTASTNRICIFEPTPLIGKNSEHRLDYNWIKTAEIEPNSAVHVLSWNIEGTRLLTGGVEIQLWLLAPHTERMFPATTTPQDEGLSMKPIKSSSSSSEAKQQQDWSCVWSCKTSTPVAHLSFSPDGTLFCSTGRSDRLVKIWYQSATQSHINSMFDHNNTIGSGTNLQASASSATSLVGIGQSHSSLNLSFSFIYIAHPRAVTGISWRKISKYMPKGSLANMLVTSCRDNICRLWVQTLLPEDGLVNVSQLDGVSNLVTPRSQTQRHRQKLLQRLKHMKSFSHFKRRHHLENGEHSDHHHHQHHHDDHESHPIPNLPSTFSVHDFHGYGIHGTSVTPGGLHFHLTATINAENDIPLVPSLSQHLSESDIPGLVKQCPKVVINNSEPRVASPTIPMNYSAHHLHHHHHHHHEESDKPLFVVQWLNNKEMAFTQNAEKVMHEIVGNIIESERQQKLQQEQQDAMSETSNNSNNEQTSVVESVINNRNKPFSRASDDIGGGGGGVGGPGHAAPASIASSSTNSLATMAVGSTTGTDGGAQAGSDHANRFENRKTVADYLDRKLESLMRDWHTTSDLLYSIHPLDGSLLVWLVEWLDEPSPSTFRQPQISFSSRIPNSIPLGDASTMSHNICLYSPSSFLDLKTVMSTLSNHTAGALSNDVQQASMDQTSQQELQQFAPISLVHQSQQQQHQLQPLFGLASNASPTLFMITKHNNGSLNLWQLVFGERSQFTQVLSISHSRRVCGHRFRVNDISCHSILPLLLTTSHHNIPGISANSRRDLNSPNTPDSTSLLVSPSSHDPQNTLGGESSTLPNTGFCSELILWKVEPVGPLLKSGGVSELARINSLESTAFSNVAWIPTLLPSTALGSISNSPSACFVASDGRQLRIYQAVIDARSLLAEAQRYMINSSDRNNCYYDSSEEEDSDDNGDATFKSSKSIRNQSAHKSDQEAFRSLFKIVSLQSTARPGCVLELSPIVDARHDWQNTQLLHVFQKQLIFGNQFEPNHGKKSLVKQSQTTNKPSTINNTAPEIALPNGPTIDLGSHALSVFEEVFYLVVVEKTGTGSTIHMWQIIISSRGKISLDDYGVGGHHQQQDDEDSSRSVSPDNKSNNTGVNHFNSGQVPPLRIRTRKVCTQPLPLPVDVEVIHASPSAGHLSSSNIYPACYASFLISTACSDNKLRFWRCEVKYNGKQEEKDNEYSFNWLEWEMSLKSEPKQTTFDMSFQVDSLSSTLDLPGSPLYVSCAYSGRIACAFKFGHSYMDLQEEPQAKKEENRFINIGIVIYECQSSGGSEWILEDTIRIDRIPLLEMNQASMAKLSDIDLAPLVDTTLRNHQTSKKLTSRMSSNSLASNNNPFANEMFESIEPMLDHTNRVANIQRLLSVPSYTTIQSLKKIIAEQGNQFTFFQKSPVLLDWVSTEDGFHILSCSAGHKIALFAPVSVQSTQPTSNTTEVAKSSDTPVNNQVKPNSLQAVTFKPKQASVAGASVSPSNFRLNLLDPLLNTMSVTRWMMLRMTELDSVDGLPPLPMQMAWVRDGILVVGMDNEMIIFTQWKMSIPNSLPNVFENKQLNQKTKRPMATNFLFDSVDFPSERFFNLSQQKQDEMNPNKKLADPIGGTDNDQLISELPDDFGIFESFRMAFPVIPQYHPKQLMELLAFGKIHRVRAILCHLVSSLISINSIKEYLHHPANMQPQHGNSFESERSPRSWTRTRALSVSAQQHSSSSHDLNSSPMDHSFGDPIVAEEIQLDYTEIASIRPLPLYALMQADEGISTEKMYEEKNSKNDSGFALSLDINETLDPDSLFDYNYKTQVEETLDEFLGNRTAFNFSNVATSKFIRNQQQASQQQQPELDTDLHISINFDQRQARLLTKLLTHSHLPGLTSLDQMHLLALADSLTSFDELAGQSKNTDDEFGYAKTSSVSIDDQQLTVTANSLDDCGLRYLLNMRQHIYLLKCLPLYQRKVLQKNGLGLHNIIWAYHSETQEELVQLIPSLTSTNNKVTWQELREFGVGFWIRSNSLLRKVIEKLAKSAFKTNNDPLDAALYYMAMKKKNLVWGLYRSIQDKKMTDFFSHDFTEDKWRKAALKNAYALMGKQRFEHAVSFFLLAGSLWDAVEICLNRLDDLQLAMVVIRLYGGGDLETVPDTLKRLLNDEILGYRQGVQDINYAHPNPFLRSMAYWTLHEYNQALDTLLEVNVGSKHCKIAAGLSMAASNYTTPLPPGQNNFEALHPSVFNFYLYLRTQPLIVRRAQVAQQNIDSTSTGNSALFSSSNKNLQLAKSKKSHMFSISTTNRSDAVAITPFERRLFFLTAYRHLRAGCPALALEVLSRLPTNILSYSEKSQIDECSRRMSVPEGANASASGTGVLFDLESKSTSIQSIQSKAEDLFASSSGGFDWGAPTSTLFQPVATDEFKITFDDDNGDKVSDEEDQEDGLQMKQVSPTGEKVASAIESADEDHPIKIDVMAQQFKFISCLKIIMEELSTLATGFEVDGGQLRYQLYIWLERSVQTLKEVCSYDTFSMRSFQDRGGSFDGASEKNEKALMPSLSSFDRQNSSVLVTTATQDRKSSQQSTTSTTTTALHEILLADKEDFESKLERCRRRKAWLTANEALLRNLLSYCSLHGAQGGLASVRMELILLLQELQQDRSPQQQLLSPLPLPTTLPLLTSAVASQKTVVADPIRHLQSGIHDILETLVDINTYVHLPTNTAYSTLPDYLALPPFMISGTAANLTSWSAAQDHPPAQQSGSYISTLYTLIHILRQLGISLSSCLYQSLCDCDTVMHNSSISSTNPGYNRFNNKNGTRKKSSLTTAVYKTKSDSATLNPIPDSSSLSAVTSAEEPLTPVTSPYKWPGVQSLQALIVRDKDEDLPKLHTMLCEGFVAVYLSQLVYALTICDSSILYRLIGMDFTEKSWGELFGGGTKKLLYVSAASLMSGLGQTPGSATPADLANGSATVTANAASPHGDLLNTLSKQRMKLHMKILEQLNQASAAAVAAGAAAAEAVSAVSSGMVNVATSPSGNMYNIGGQLMQNPPQSSAGSGDQRPTYREVFVPPQVSIINYLMRKPKLSDDLSYLDYDSMGSDEDADEDQEDSAFGEKFKTTNDDEIDDDEYDEWVNGGKKTASHTKLDRAQEKRKANLEYELYAWCIIRLAATKIAHQNINNFLTVTGLEKGDLPTTSPLIHSILKTLVRWQCAMQFYMNEYTNLPDHFLPNMYVDTDKTQGPAILKYKSLLENNNTPFRRGYTSIKPCKRLWNYLVRQPSVQDLFIRYIFGKSRSLKLARDHGASAICNTEPGTAVYDQYDQDHKSMQTGGNQNNDDGINDNVQTADKDKDAYSVMPGKRVPDPMRIVHKDQDIISAFCVNRSNAGLISLSTQKEIQEINIKPLLDSCVPWMEEDTELDILNLRQKHDLSYPLATSYVDFLLVQHPTDRLQTSPGGQAIQRQLSTVSATSQQPQTKTILIKRHKTETVRRLASHPSLPLYLSGGQDGSVNLWEWNHQMPISTARPAGTFAKVTRVQFNQQGNKFGVTDSDGNLSLWQVSAAHNQPFFSLQCHNKTTSDFTFLGSSSLLMTAGHSTDHKNIVLWDTLMPVKKCMVSSFSCHEHSGAASIAYAPLNQILITGGRKGDVFIFDMRQRIQRERFQAHDSAVKCIALDPGEDFFATGSADGDIKVWSLVNSGRNLIFSFPGEHARSTFFRNIGMGVSHLYIDNCGRLFSCGADGSLKMRHLPTVECQPKYFFSPTSPSSQSLLFGSQQQQQENEPPLISMRPPANVNNDYFNGNGIVNTY